MHKLQQSKSLLTKLLATENISVEYRNVETASFNVKSRTLILPLWEDMSPELYDLLGGHEVGHALFTPEEGWHDAVVNGIGPGFRTFLNVIEDARIENAIKSKYPGIRKSFSKAYRELIEKDFFGTKNRNPNKFLLIDRINLYFKCGVAMGIEFKPEEKVFIDKINQVQTWDDVVAVSRELYEYCREELKNQYREQAALREQMKKQGLDEEFDDDESGGGFGEDYSEWDEDGAESFDDESEDDSDDRSNSKTQGKKDESDFDEDETPDGNGKGTSGNNSFNDMMDDEPEPYSITDKNFQEKIQSLSQKKLVNNGSVSSFADMDVSKLIVDWKKIVGKVVDHQCEVYRQTFFADFEVKNKNAINYLVKEFEMRKKASELRRVSLADTGTIDTNLLHAYKFDDNIFRKIASVPEGKNHGLFIVVDWSGSMSDNMKGTIEQMLVLTLFCRKIGVPFEVYAFSTEYANHVRKRGTPEEYEKTFTRSWIKTNKETDIAFDTDFHLINLLSSRMGNQAFRNMANDLLGFGEAYGKFDCADRYKYRELLNNTALTLGGTPLNATIMAMSKMVNEFKINNRLEVVNAIILTDGEDSSVAYTSPQKYYDRQQIGPEIYNRQSYVFDNETKKTYKVKGSITETLLQILKDRTGCNLIGFYIVGPRKNSFMSAFSRLMPNNIANADSAFGEFKNEKVHTLCDVGYDEYYLIPGGDELITDNDGLDDLLGGNNTQITARKLRGAFIKMNQNRLTNRVLLKKFIEQVA